MDKKTQDVEACGKELLKTIEEVKEITVSNILDVCFKLMNVAEQFISIPGVEKKKLVLDVITTFGKEKGVPEVLLALIPYFIDKAIDLKDGKLSFDEVEAAATGCCCFKKK